MSRLIDITGKEFGRLVVLERVPGKARYVMWKCLCKCGNYTTARGSHIRYGLIRSCGCLAQESRIKHGMYKTLTYSSWQHMKERCLSPKHRSFKNYGERGITICPQWIASFETFLKDMGEAPPGLTLDRRDNDGNYTPDNCRWATPEQQMNNQRTTKFATINGETKAVKYWCQETGVKYNTAMKRICQGIPPHIAVTIKACGLRGTPYHQVYTRQNALAVTIEGVRKSVQRWCEELKIVSSSTAIRRIRRGVPPKLAVTIKGHGLRKLYLTD